MYHQSEDHVGVGDEVAEAAALMGKVEPEVYSTFISFQESLMQPYTSTSGKIVDDDTYQRMLGVAATLTSACAVLAAAETKSPSISSAQS